MSAPNTGEPNLTGYLRPPARERTIRVLAFALTVAVIAWYFGTDVWHALLLGVAVTIAGLVSVLGTGSDVTETRWRVRERRDRAGSRSDVAALSWSLRASYGRVGRTAVGRVQRIAKQRLALHHLDLLDPNDRPKIEALIGRRSYLVLTRGDRRPPLMRSFLSCLDALDALDPTRPAPPHASSQSRTPNFAQHRSRRKRER
jgi:hypothetical protein